jgi:putative glutamine amidotransferase
LEKINENKKMTTKILKYLCLLSFFLIIGCDSQEKSDETAVDKSQQSVLLISKDGKGNIRTWMRSLDSEITIVECYGLSNDSLDYYLNIAGAIIIGGGNDVNPERYNKPEYAVICGKFDNYRDSLEFKMIHYASENKIPIMGICRGQQIINVAHGGSLIPDIPTYVNEFAAHRDEEGNSTTHYILPVKETWLTEYIQQDTFWVNSIHHQCVDRLAKGFEVAAYAPDSVIEAIFIRDKSIHPFTMGVQFHPEILRDSISNQFGILFLNSID